MGRWGRRGDGEGGVGEGGRGLWGDGEGGVMEREGCRRGLWGWGRGMREEEEGAYVKFRGCASLGTRTYELRVDPWLQGVSFR